MTTSSQTAWAVGWRGRPQYLRKLSSPNPTRILAICRWHFSSTKWQRSHCFPKLQYGTVMLTSRSGRVESWFGGSGPTGKAGAIEAHVHHILGNSNRPETEPWDQDQPLSPLSHIPKDRVSVFLQQSSRKAPSRVRVDSEGYLLIISAFQVAGAGGSWVQIQSGLYTKIKMDYGSVYL